MIMNTYNNQNEDERQDKNLQIFYDKIKKVMMNVKNIIFIDPFDKEGRDQILNQL